ncbi:hypothetical protein NMG60_11025612 [Bertholletia excelsa]
MKSPSKQRFNPQQQPQNAWHYPRSQLIQNLISAIQSPQDRNPSLLKSLYYLLVHWSLSPPTCDSRFEANVNMQAIKTGQCLISVSFEDLCSLSDILFKELPEMFKQFISTMRDVSTSGAQGPKSLHLNTLETAEQLNLLLRCCMVMLNLLVSDQHRLLDNGQILLSILGKLFSLYPIQRNKESTISFEKFSCQYVYEGKDCATSFNEDIVASLHFVDPVDPCLSFICNMLEVFADELLVHGQLREYFMLIDSHSSASTKLFMCRSSHGDVGSIIEVICTHFFLSFSDEEAFENYLRRLFWLHREDFRAPELSMSAALVLLLNPVMPAAPKFLQAHVISLVSESLAFAVELENKKSDVRLMHCYISAFERSVILYVKHMSTLQMNDYLTADKDSIPRLSSIGGNYQPSFESCIQPVTREKINNLINKLDNSWQTHLHDIMLRTRSELVTSSIAYIKESENILYMLFKNEIVSILSSMALKAYYAEVDGTALHATGETSVKDICLLAAILKLMSCSLLQAIRCLVHSGSLGSLKQLRDFPLCREYDSIVGIISCFQQFNIGLPVQKSFCSIVDSHQEQHKESKIMLLHFLGLLSLSFHTGLDFLVKGCISTMVALMNLFIFEDGNLDALCLNDRPQSFSSELPDNNVQEAMADKRSSFALATKFQKIQTLYLRSCIRSENGQAETSTNSSTVNNLQYVVGIEEETEETCNGKIFLDCILENSQNTSDFDDLTDFIECKKGKDYSDWLKDREKYRKWKCEKKAVLRWKMKKRTWRFRKGKNT